MSGLVKELRQHAKAAWLTLYRQHPCWKAADRIEALAAEVVKVKEWRDTAQPGWREMGALDPKARDAAAQLVDPSGIFNLAWQECQERADAIISAYLEADAARKAETKGENDDA